MNIKHSRAQAAIIVFLAILLFGGISALVVHPVYSGPSVSSGWEFAGWQYRKEHNVTTSAGDQTDYPVNLVVHYGGNEISEWVTKAPMPYALADVATATYNGQIYVFGGYGTDSSDVKNYTLRYDPSSDTWTRMADMPTPRWGIAAAEYNGIIYVFAGTPDGNFLHGTAETDAYNVTSNSWQTMTNVPSGIARGGLMAVTVGNRIYLFFANYTYAFDSTANGGLGSFTQEADAPMNRSWATCAYVNVGGQDRIYLIGGFDWVTILGSAANYYYDVAGNVWSSAQTAAPYAAYGTLRENPVNGGLIYYGFGRDSVFYKSLYAYNASADSWSSLLAEASYARDGLGCAFIGGNLYAIGGRNVDVNPYGLNYNEVYTQVAGDSGPTVYLNSKCRSDFGDVRFSWWNSSSQAEQPCDYWLESFTSGQTATFWVKMPELANNANNTLYVYYGKADASTTSNGANVFSFFDDFNRADSLVVGNGWTEDSDPNGALSISSDVLKIDQYENYYCHVEQAAPNLSNFTLNGKIEIGSNSGQSWAPMIYAYWGAYDWIGVGPSTFPANGIRSHMDIASTFSEATSAGGDVSYGSWVYLRIRVNSTDAYAEWSMDGSAWTTLVSIARPVSWSGAPSLIIVGKGFAQSSSSYSNSTLNNDYSVSGNMGTSYADDVFVRNYVSPEPSHGGWGPEESTVSRYLYLMLSVSPDQATYTQGQSITFDVSVLNKLTSSVNSTLTLTITGPGGYGYFDLDRIKATSGISEHSFDWTVPNVKGTYIVEVSLVPLQLTAYDAAWLGVV